MFKYKKYFKTRAEFDRLCPDPSKTNLDGNEFYTAVVHIEDTGEIYTHGRFYCESMTEDDVRLMCVQIFYSNVSTSTHNAEGIGNWDEEATVNT